MSPGGFSERWTLRQFSVFSTVGILGWTPVKGRQVRFGRGRNQCGTQAWITASAVPTVDSGAKMASQTCYLGWSGWVFTCPCSICHLMWTNLWRAWGTSLGMCIFYSWRDPQRTDSWSSSDSSPAAGATSLSLKADLGSASLQPSCFLRKLKLIDNEEKN